jgi:chitinase
MRARSTVALVAAAVALMAGWSGAGAAAGTPTIVGRGDRVVQGFFTQWSIYNGYLEKMVPASSLTTLDYAFSSIDGATGKCASGDSWADYDRPFSASESVDGTADTWSEPLRGNFKQLRELKAANPNLRVMMTIGGWTWSKYFSDVAASSKARQRFVRSCIDMYIRGTLQLVDGAGGVGAARGVFDGIDLDWEYPVCCGNPGNDNSPADRHNFTRLLREFRRQLDHQGAIDGKHYLLTADLAPAEQALVSYELRPVSHIADYVTTMTFDYNGGWSPVTNFGSPLYADPADPTTPADVKAVNNIDGTVKEYLAAGVPRSKLLISVPFYGHQFTGVTNAGNGLFQPFVEAASTPSFAAITASYLSNPAYTRFWDPATQEPYLFSPTDGNGTFISYEDAQSVRAKAAYIRHEHLLGAMFWELSNDDAQHTLVSSLSSGILR